LEPNETNRTFGGRDHVVGTTEEMRCHIPNGSLDLVVCNGVFGWVWTNKANCEKAFAAAHRALGPRG